MSERDELARVNWAQMEELRRQLNRRAETRAREEQQAELQRSTYPWWRAQPQTGEGTGAITMFDAAAQDIVQQQRYQYIEYIPVPRAPQIIWWSREGMRGFDDGGFDPRWGCHPDEFVEEGL